MVLPIAWGLVAPAFAQNNESETTASDATAGGLQDIVVTARRTAESLQTTPVAVTAVTSEVLSTRQVLNVADLQRAAPSLSVASGGTGPASLVQASIRGQGQANPGSANDSPVGIYVDGVYIGRPISSNLNALDFERIEVLRGPQGTLFGRNTTGGAINATTQAPTSTLEGYVKAGLGNYNSRLFEGVLNVPLSEEVAVRFAGRYNEHDGYVRNLATGRREDDVQGDYFARGSIKWSPDAVPLTWRIVGDYTRYRDKGSSARLRGVSGLAAVEGLGAFLNTTSFYRDTAYVNRTGYMGLPNGSGATGDRDIDTPGNSNTAWGLTSNLEIELGDTTLKAITAYRDSHSNNSWDLDATVSPNFIFGFYSEYFQKQFSQEIQLSGKIGKLDWTVGGIYFRESGIERNDSYNYGAPTQIPVGGGVFVPFPGFGGAFTRDLTNFKSTSTGLFAQGIYRFTDRLRFTAGLRYTWDKRSIVKRGLFGVTDPNDYVGSGLCATFDRAGLPASGGCADPFSASFSYPAWTAVLDYQFNRNLFVYVKTSGAALSGGFNTRAIPGPEDSAFGPEKVRDVEAGFKADLFDRHLRTNTAIFHSWRRGVQTNVNEIVGARNTQYIVNAGEARYYGVEFEATLLPWRGMEITGSAAYLHSRYASFNVPNAAGTGTLDRSGERVQQAPEWTLSLGATQNFDVPWGQVAVHGDYSYISSRAYFQDTFDPSLGPTGPSQQTVDEFNNTFGVIPAYGLFSARISTTLDNPNMEIALWARNIGQKHYYKSVFAGLYQSLGAATGAIGEPRTYGATVSFRF
jgi:iron complex outermembrane receptor protein